MSSDRLLQYSGRGAFIRCQPKHLLSQGEDVEQLKNFDRIGMLTGPVYVYAQPPGSEAEHELMLQKISEKKVPPHEQLHLYRAISDNFSERRRANVDIHEIITSKETMRKSLEEILQASATRMDDNYYVALVSRYRNIVLVFSEQNQLLGMLNAPLKDGSQ
jgi:hypothetical protein